MAKKTPNGKSDYENEEWSFSGVNDALHGRSAQSVPAAYQAAYDEAYRNATYWKGVTGFNRTTI
jgi:hypothetical protein